MNLCAYNKFKVNICEKLTTSSNAFDIWRDHYLKDQVFLLDAEKDINVRQAIYGARSLFTPTAKKKAVELRPVSRWITNAESENPTIEVEIES